MAAEEVTRTPRLDSLTSLRALAALMVFNIHIGYVFAHTHLHALPALFEPGRAAVSLFFILSGFVLTWGYDSRVSTLGFFRRRAARIFPLVILTWTIGLGVSVLDHRPIPFAGALMSLLLVQAWNSDEAVFLAVNGVSWTLSCEIFFYLLFAPTRRWWVQLGPSASRLGMAAVVCAVVLVAVAAAAGAPTQVPGVPRTSFSDAYWAATIFPPTRALEFFFGVLLARELRAGRLPHVSLKCAVPLSVGALIACLFLPFGLTEAAATMIPFGLLVVALAQSDLSDSPRPSPLRHPVLVRLGELTFAFYIVHGLITRTVLTAWGTTLGQALRIHFDFVSSIGAWATALLMATGAAWLAHRYVEVPFERRLRGAPSHSRLLVPHPVVSGGLEPLERR